jgi:hypothetical protein
MNQCFVLQSARIAGQMLYDTIINPLGRIAARKQTSRFDGCG